MNFFTVGFVLLSINLDFDMPLNYALKLAGVSFMYGGVKEYQMALADCAR